MGGKRCALHAMMYDPGFDHRDARSIGHSPVIDRTDDDYPKNSRKHQYGTNIRGS